MAIPNYKNKQYNSEIGIGLLLIGLSILCFRLFPEYRHIFKLVLNIPMLLIVIGIFRGFNTSFKSNDWWILVLIGSFFFLSKIIKIIPGLNPDLFFPIAIITVGIILLLRKRKNISTTEFTDHTHNDIPILPITSVDQLNDANFDASSQSKVHLKENDANNTLHLETLLGNNSRMVLSKNFKGGNCSTILGSSTLYLNKSDFNGIIYINNFCLLGETTIIVPSHFNIINQITSVLGSVDDKRNFMQEQQEQKSIVLKGQCILGSVTIKNF